MLTVLTEYRKHWHKAIIYAKQYSKYAFTRNENICSKRIIFGRA